MAAASAGQKVALPQQGVAVQINDGQGAMQRAGLFADLRQRAALDLVHAAFDDAGCKQEKGSGGHEQQGEEAEYPATHQRVLVSVTKLSAGQNGRGAWRERG